MSQSPIPPPIAHPAHLCPTEPRIVELAAPPVAESPRAAGPIAAPPVAAPPVAAPPISHPPVARLHPAAPPLPVDRVLSSATSSSTEDIWLKSPPTNGHRWQQILAVACLAIGLFIGRTAISWRETTPARFARAPLDASLVTSSTDNNQTARRGLETNPISIAAFAPVRPADFVAANDSNLNAEFELTSPTFSAIESTAASGAKWTTNPVASIDLDATTEAVEAPVRQRAATIESTDIVAPATSNRQTEDVAFVPSSPSSPVALGSDTPPSSTDSVLASLDRKTAPPRPFSAPPSPPVCKGPDCNRPEMRQLGTTLAWASTPAEAAHVAKQEAKLVFLIHVSGNFEIPGFT